MSDPAVERRILAVERRLREAGFRVTVQRQMIAGALIQAGGHRTAEQIREDVSAAYGHRLTLSTVYRTLNDLRERRLVGQVDRGRGNMLFEWLDDEYPHHHALCVRCGGEQSLSSLILERFEQSVRRELGFEAHLDHLVILGVCRACADAASEAGSSPS